MVIDSTTWLWAAGALLGVLAGIGVLARLVHSAGLASPASGRRLQLREVLPIDSRHRLLLIRCDGREVLLLTGSSGNALIGWLPPAGQEEQ